MNDGGYDDLEEDSGDTSQSTGDEGARAESEAESRAIIGRLSRGARAADAGGGAARHRAGTRDAGRAGDGGDGAGGHVQRPVTRLDRKKRTYAEPSAGAEAEGSAGAETEGSATTEDSSAWA